MNDDEFRRRLDRLAKDAPSPDAERARTVHAARRRARVGVAVAGVVGAAAIVVGVLAVNIAIDRPQPPVPSVIGPGPTGTAVPAPTQSTTPPPEPLGALAFWSWSGSSASLTLINADGSHRQTVGDLSISTSRLSLSPVGTQAVFDRGMSEGDGQLEVVDLRSGEVRTIFTDGDPGSPDWSPEGDRIVFHTDRAALLTVPVSGATEATAVRDLGSDEFLQGLFPSWSPDGQELAFISPKSGAVEIIPVAGRSAATTIEVGGTAMSLDWGVQGIVASVTPEGGGDSSLVMIDPVDGSVDPLPDVPGDEFDPALSPDGMFVAFGGNADGQQDIYVMRLSDGRRWRLTDDDRGDRSPVWLPGS